MKLSNETISVLKNFSTINQNLVIKAGSELSTMSALKNIVASATVKDIFPQEVAIYDLNEFLSALSLFEEPVLDFKERFVVIQGKGKNEFLNYWYSDPSVVTTPQKNVTMPDPEVSFNLSSTQYEEIKKGAAILSAPDMCLEAGDVNWGLIKVTDKKNLENNTYAVKIDVDTHGNNNPYKYWFRVENLKLLGGDYSIKMSSKRISHFSNNNVPIEYWIALESETTYNNS